MVRQFAAALAVSLAAMLPACQEPQSFRSQDLGPVAFDEAYDASLDVLSQYYRVQTADRADGRITTYPRQVDGGSALRLSSVPTREQAILQLREADGTLWADVQVRTQRQEAASYRTLARMGETRDVPNQTPAQDDAPYTAEQQSAWTNAGFNYPREREILADLYRRLHPETALEAEPALEVPPDAEPLDAGDAVMDVMPDTLPSE